jgi:ribosome-binding ATPase YchF (GTP1/OBG family)
MKLGIVGLPQAGKTSIFTALTGEPPGADAAAGRSVTKIVRVPDTRLEKLREVFKPRSFKPATFEVTDFGAGVSREARLALERESDAMLVILNAYSTDPKKQLAELETEWMLSDQGQVEKRAEKLRVQVKKPTPKEEKERDTLELAAVEKALAALQKETPLRQVPFEEKERAAIKHFGLFTLKPMLLVENIAETSIGKWKQAIPGSFVVAGKLEGELACMAPDERATFLTEYGITEPARERLIHAAYKLLGLHAFFTSGEDEVRAWTIPMGTKAPQAAGAIHSDIERGFIRAEVVHFDDFDAAGATMKGAKAANKVRLEGKDYVVKDGDMIEFRFSV